MKKTLLITSIVLVCLLSLPLLTIFTLMKTQYANNVINLISQHFTPYSITVGQAVYTPPYQFTFEDVLIDSQPKAIQVPKLTIWLDRSFLLGKKLSLDSVLIEGANLSIKQLNSTLLRTLNIEQLALKHLDITAPTWSARDVSLQIIKPQWGSDEQDLPYGNIQLSTKQLYVDGEAFDDLLIDAQYQKQDSTIYGASFKWQNADVSGQAEQLGLKWSLINVTVNRLNLDNNTQIDKLFSSLRTLNVPVNHINSLDVLDSNIHFKGWQFTQLDASFENLLLDHSIWDQSKGVMSFNAESANYGKLRFLSPSAQLSFDPNRLSVNEFDADFKQGRVQLSGVVKPEEIALQRLDVSGVKWTEDTDQLMALIQSSPLSLETFSIDELDIHNIQFIQVEHRPYWQVSGLNIEGKHLTLIEQQQTGLFNGNLELSVSNASVDKVLTTQALVQAQAENGNITLKRAFIPLASGYIEANGKWQRELLSEPWTLSVHADGLPLDNPNLQERLPFDVTGLAEIKLELSGLSGDYRMLAHSLSGSVNVDLHSTQIAYRDDETNAVFQQRWPLDNLLLSADRGRITINAHSDSAQLAGRIDLTKPQFGSLIFTTQQGCQRLWSDVIALKSVVKEMCGNTPNHSP
ncbi:AsmA family protein [Vibrio ostreicida]|uniref:AsmA family protein n=1 Tax=Vibrio ostreicida TaxID=526588 RepID=A0ABT8BNT6_9VIBR|nr:AsmA family protein [Vibrio ostreicida]MDN3608568.1 AsmA family protein [Vibrio ostreicida]NPD10700.1 AsmA family protein [Vibrio ostreicida]